MRARTNHYASAWFITPSLVDSHEKHKKAQEEGMCTCSHSSNRRFFCIFVLFVAISVGAKRLSTDLRHQILLDVELGRAKVDEQAGFHACRSQITEELCYMLIGNCRNRFEFDK